MTDATDHKSWSELSPVTQAALRCKEPVFWVFLKENGFTFEKIQDEEAAARVVRDVCQIGSRSELANDPRAQATWYDLENLFAAWKGRDR
jgi:hypothetical protein